MERIVYVLGAGFSAPLGLPLIPNFLLRAKDLYFGDRDKYSSFGNVFDRIENLAKTKNIFAADLYNIEEILSILEMSQHFGEGPGHREFVDFLGSVIAAYTPRVNQPIGWASNWAPGAFAGSPHSSGFGYFVADLCGVELRRTFLGGHADENTATPHNSHYSYSVITLNYDLVLETYWEYIRTAFRAPSTHGFERAPTAHSLVTRTPLIKLHGSVDTDDIVPPTWSKSIHPEILPVWKAAFSQLSMANHVRFIGYSLPPGDSYIRYLLKAALPMTTHLKSVHAICLDDKRQTVETHYREFFDFNFFRFENRTTEEYLSHHQLNAINSAGTAHLPGKLEVTHQEFFA